ncbi:MAG: hypothetical protein IT472_06020, partial [Thermomonas sp.]|uniref:hypothetical protein n=1 Tax=Thermomonas sp. TaxID=1971895 RepID=UPI002606FB33
MIVCWTKPNHAFFMCQQSCAKFFLATPAIIVSNAITTDAGQTINEPATSVHAMSRIAARKQWRGLQGFDDIDSMCFPTSRGATDIASAPAQRAHAGC